MDKWHSMDIRSPETRYGSTKEKLNISTKARLTRVPFYINKFYINSVNWRNKNESWYNMRAFVQINNNIELCEISKAIVRPCKSNCCQYELCLIQAPPMTQAYVVTFNSEEEAVAKMLQMSNEPHVNMIKEPTKEVIVRKYFDGTISVVE